jgi:hypothetical protein
MCTNYTYILHCKAEIRGSREQFSLLSLFESDVFELCLKPKSGFSSKSKEVEKQPTANKDDEAVPILEAWSRWDCLAGLPGDGETRRRGKQQDLWWGSRFSTAVCGVPRSESSSSDPVMLVAPALIHKVAAGLAFVYVCVLRLSAVSSHRWIPTIILMRDENPW